MISKRNIGTRSLNDDPMLKSRNDLPIIKVPVFMNGNMRKLKRSMIVENVLHQKKTAKQQALKAQKKGSQIMTNHVQKRHIQEFRPVSYDLSAPEDHVVVLPEEVNDLPSDEIIRLPRRGEPEINFSKLTVESVFKGVSKVVSEYENFCIDYNNDIVGKKDTIADFFKLIEENLYPAECAHNLLVLMATIDPSSYEHSEIHKLMERFYKARNLRVQTEFRRSLDDFVARDCEKLRNIEKKMLYFYNMPKLGVNLRSLDEASIALERTGLWKQLTRFSQNLFLTNQAFKHTVDDPDILSKISNELDDFSDLHHKERTPFQVTATTYKKFMQVCPDRFVRQMLWQTYHKRCSPKGTPKYNNFDPIRIIRVHRRRIAEIAGFRTHADYKRVNSMVKSRNEILDNFKQVHEEIKPKLSEHLQELNDYASDNNFYDPSQIGIQEYDLDYWVHRYAHDIIIGMNERDLKTLFPLQTVMQGMQNFFEEHYNIKLKTVKNPSNLVTDDWIGKLQYIEVTDCDQPLGTIVFCPFRRDGKPLHNMFYARIRSRNRELDCLPCRFIGASYQLDPSTRQAHLGLKEVLDTFKCFATVIQRLLYDYEFYELNNLGALEVEAKDLFPNLCVTQLLNDHRILQSFSRRGDSKQIDAELTNRIVKAIAFSRPFKTWHDLYKAHLDLEINSRLDDAKKIAEEIYSIYSPFEREPDYYDFCAMDSVIVGPEDATHYASILSKQMANFCLGHIPSENERKREFCTNLRRSLFSPDKFDTNEKLFSLIGQNFEPSKSSLGML